MTQPFSPLEEQLLRSSLTTKTDEEIAEILDRSVEDIRTKIAEITGVDCEIRTADVKKYQEELIISKNRKIKKPSIKKKVFVTKKEISKKPTAETKWIEQRENNRKREARGAFKTKKVDYSEMRTVRVNKNTLVYVNKNVTDQEAISLYEKNMANKERPWLPTHDNNKPKNKKQHEPL